MPIALILLCIGFTLLQGAAALPWLLAVNYRWRSRWYRPKPLGIAVLSCVGFGVVAALFLDANSDPAVLAGSVGLPFNPGFGRLYGAVLQLQFSADFFVGIFWLLLTAWPKGGAVAHSAFRESVRQPMYWVLTSAGLLILGVPGFFGIPIGIQFIPYFTFGEDLKMVKEIGYSIIMVLSGIFAVLAASMSISEEIEGRTAVTLMSKPVSRRQFLLGKFGGILLAALFMTVLLGWVFLWIILFKYNYDYGPFAEVIPDPAWVLRLTEDWFGRESTAHLMRGWGFWIHDAWVALPGLVISFCQVMVLLAVAVALATRVPFIVNLIACLLVYFLGHLTPIMTAVTRERLALVHFVAQLFETLLPGLDLFDVGTAVVRPHPLPPLDYALYALNIALYAATFTTITLLFGLILFEDRDLA